MSSICPVGFEGPFNSFDSIDLGCINNLKFKKNNFELIQLRHFLPKNSLSNVYQLLTMGQLPIHSHSGPYISWGPMISNLVPSPREKVSHKESISSDRSSKLLKSENGS